MTTSPTSTTRSARPASKHYEPGCLPPLREIAEDLQDGVPIEDLCTRYAVQKLALVNHLRAAGYKADGSVVGRSPLNRVVRPLVQSAGGTSNHVGGGDNHDGLPYTAVRYRTPKPKPTGLDWSRYTAPQPAAAAVRVPAHAVLQGNGHTYLEAQPDEYDEVRGNTRQVSTSTPRKTGHHRRGRPRPSLLSEEHTRLAVVAYGTGLSVAAIAKQLGTTTGIVSGALKREGVKLRSRSEGQKTRFQAARGAVQS
jgi:hypothetical protein